MNANIQDILLSARWAALSTILAAGCGDDGLRGSADTGGSGAVGSTGGNTSMDSSKADSGGTGATGSPDDESGGAQSSGGTGGTGGFDGSGGSGGSGGSDESGGTGGGQGGVEIGGVWNDDFGGWTYITEERWGQRSIHEYSNDDNWLVEQNPATDEWNPNAFSYVVWTEPDEDGRWFTCTVAFGIETLEEALGTENSADDSDPANAGCGGFSWTEMSPREEIELTGSWDDDYGGQTEVLPDQWGSTRIRDYANDDNWAVTRNPDNDEWNPGKFNYVVWTEPEDEGWWTCTVAFGLDTASEALETELEADDSDPANGGCGDFPWTRMTPAD